MLDIVRSVAHLADAWLRGHVRAYSAILNAGLVIAIVDSARKLAHAVSDRTVHDLGDVLGIASLLVFQGALLLNQLAQWHEYSEHMRARRAGR